jgi:hypothetical protein
MARQPSWGCGTGFQLRTFFLTMCGLVIVRTLMIYRSYDFSSFDNDAKAFLDIPIVKSSTVSLAMLDIDTTLAVASSNSPPQQQQQTTTGNLEFASTAFDEFPTIAIASITSPDDLNKQQRNNGNANDNANANSNSNANANSNSNHTRSKNKTKHKTLSLLYPAGLIGGYRNQAMRFIGLVKHAIDMGYDNLLLPTLVWSTRYSTSNQQLIANTTINQAVRFWPVPFDELFDVDHWNTFYHHHHQQQHHQSASGSSSRLQNNTTNGSGGAFSLPRLVSSVYVDDETNSSNSSSTPNSNHVCWKPNTDDSIVSVETIQRNKNPNFTRSFLPLLTSRMLFGNNNDNDKRGKDGVDDTNKRSRNAFVLDPIQADVMEFLTGDKMARTPHKLDLSKSVNDCTHPYVFGGKSSKLWNSFLQIDKKPHKSYSKLVETVEEALVPAKPWRVLADRCVEYHLGLGDDEFKEEEEDPHALGHDHRYIALHARVEPEMLHHKCGKNMERNLTKILELVELFSLDYNSDTGGLPESAKERARELSYTSPISNDLRQQLLNSTHLKGAFVAVARDELNDMESYPKLFSVTSHNRGYLNQRSISYDANGSELYTQTLEAREREQNERQTHTQKQKADDAFISSKRRKRRLGEDKDVVPHNTDDDDNKNKNQPLPIFECGEGWVNHAFYASEDRQKKLFTPSSSSELEKDYGLYQRYGPNINNNDDGEENRSFPLLPLPQNYFGDVLPSMLNFWLAVRADVFVGVRKSSWSTDVWTTRYYYGRGDRNFEYTSDRGILAIENGGLAPNHKTC